MVAINNVSMRDAARPLWSEIEQPFSATNFVSTLLTTAVALGVSDVHIDPERARTRIQFRIDGLLELAGTLPPACHSAVLARIKIISSLRTDEHQTAQDGRFDVSLDVGWVHVRVTVMPCYFGERVVLRILRDLGVSQNLATIGMSAEQQAVTKRALEQSHGMVLVSGPTGSGKTTTLYALVRLLQHPGISIVTLEDPIEYVLEGTVQIPIYAQRGVTFATGLRSILRQDPNVIMVGEIRDAETARLAVQAALTGHLVLSSIHTTEASSVCVRLLDLGIEPYLIAATLHVVIAQRLVRTRCVQCTKGAASMPVTGQTECAVCRGSGYAGRCGLFEVLPIRPDIQALLMHGPTVAAIRELARSSGVVGLGESGKAAIAAGHTTEVEVRRVLSGVSSAYV